MWTGERFTASSLQQLHTTYIQQQFGPTYQLAWLCGEHTRHAQWRVIAHYSSAFKVMIKTRQIAIAVSGISKLFFNFVKWAIEKLVKLQWYHTGMSQLSLSVLNEWKKPVSNTSSDISQFSSFNEQIKSAISLCVYFCFAIKKKPGLNPRLCWAVKKDWVVNSKYKVVQM